MSSVPESHDMEGEADLGRFAAKLRQASDEWAQMVDSCADMICVVDKEHKVKRINRSMASAAGLTIRECLGRHCHELVHGASRPHAYCPHMLTMETGVTHSIEIYEPHLGKHLVLTTSPIFAPDGTVQACVHVTRDNDERVHADQTRQQLIQELQARLSEIKTLQAILPTCSYCNKIRDDAGYWHQVEEYISTHTDSEFSHGICPECASQHFPGYFSGAK